MPTLSHRGAYLPGDDGPDRPTMADVARRAEVSIKTVSRVVNGESRGQSGDDHAGAEIIEELG